MVMRLSRGVRVALPRILEYGRSPWLSSFCLWICAIHGFHLRTLFVRCACVCSWDVCNYVRRHRFYAIAALVLYEDALVMINVSGVGYRLQGANVSMHGM
jgi:hypothetical protein